MLLHLFRPRPKSRPRCRAGASWFYRLQSASLQDNGELHDPEVQALLRSAEAGERILAPDVTEEERREIENFDLRNYV